MADFLVREAWFEDAQLARVTIIGTAEPAAPDWHLQEPHVVAMDELVTLLKQGAAIEAVFGPNGQEKKVPVVLVQNGGRQTADVVDGELRLADLQPGV